MAKLSSNQLIGVIIVVVVVIAAAGVTYALVSDNNDQPQPIEQERDSSRQRDSSPQPSPDATTDTNSNTGAETEPAISRERAGQIVTDEFGGVVEDIDDDSYNNRPTWEVEVRDSREGNIEAEVDRQTGEILYWERDD